MNPIVISQSMTGFTERYAGWIAEELGCDKVHVKKCTREILKNHDTVIFGGSVYAVGILGIDFLEKNIDLLKDKALYIFASGLSPMDKESIDKIAQHIPKSLKDISQFYYFRGGFVFDRLNFVNKTIIRFLRRSLKKKGDEASRNTIEAMSSDVDFTDRKYIYPMVSRIRMMD